MLIYTKGDEGWLPTANEETTALIQIFKSAKVSLPFLKGKKHALPFYENTSLFALTDMASLPAVTRYALGDIHNDIWAIDWSIETIIDINKNLGFKLTTDNVIAYTKFALEFTRGPYGRMILIENNTELGDMPSPPPIQQLHIIDKTEKGSFHLEGNLLFEGAILLCTLLISPNGHIEITKETIINQSAPDFFDPLAML